MSIHRGILYCLERVTCCMFTYRMKYYYHCVLLEVSPSPKIAEWALYTIAVKQMQEVLKLRRQ